MNFSVGSKGKNRLHRCPSCDQALPESTVKCNSCEVSINTQSPKILISEIQIAVQETRDNDLSLRLEKELRRTELLSYAAAGLAIAIFAVIILIHFL